MNVSYYGFLWCLLLTKHQLIWVHIHTSIENSIYCSFKFIPPNHFAFSFIMEYSIIEGKKLNSTNYECQGFRYVKSGEYGNSIYTNCALFRSNSCACTGKIDKQTNLLELNAQHNHDAAMHRSEKIIVSNTIKRKAEVSSENLREVFNDTCRGLYEASSVTFKTLESSMFKRGRILHPKMPSSALEFNSLLQGSLSFTNHLQTIIAMDGVAVIWGSSTIMNNLSIHQLLSLI